MDVGGKLKLQAKSKCRNYDDEYRHTTIILLTEPWCKRQAHIWEADQYTNKKSQTIFSPDTMKLMDEGKYTRIQYHQDGVQTESFIWPAIFPKGHV